MTALLAAAVSVPGVLSGPMRLLFFLPLCLSVAIVYKTLRCAHLREIPAAAAVLWVTIVAGMFAVGIALWLLYTILA